MRLLFCEHLFSSSRLIADQRRKKTPVWPDFYFLVSGQHFVSTCQRWFQTNKCCKTYPPNNRWQSMNLAHDAIAQMQAKMSSSTIQHFLIETFSGIHTVARNIFKSAKQPTCSHSHFVFMNHFTVTYNEYLQRVLSLQFCCFFMATNKKKSRSSFSTYFFFIILHHRPY